MPHKNVGPPDLPKGPANDKHKGECFAPLNMPAATKSITLQEDKPSLRVTSMCKRSANFASASDFAILKCLSGLEIHNFHEISASELDTGAIMQSLASLGTSRPR